MISMISFFIPYSNLIEQYQSKQKIIITKWLETLIETSRRLSRQTRSKKQ